MMLYGWLIFSSFLWGTNVLVMKYMLENTSTYFLAVMKVFLSVIAIFGIMKYKKIAFKWFKGSLSLKVSLFSITINFILTFEGLNLINGSSNAIVNSLAPLVTILLAGIFFHTKVSRNQIMAMIIAALGFFVSLDFDFSQISMGHIMMIGAIVLYSYGNLLMQHQCRQEDSLPFTLQYLCFGLVELLIVMFFVPSTNHFENISITLWLLFIIFSGIGFAIIQLVYFHAVHQIGSVKASFLLGLNPVFTYIGSLLLQEQFSFNKFLAMGLMVLAMVIANKKIAKNDYS